jgi:oxygen-independent coproporphyrinogen-3 oxidase
MGDAALVSLLVRATDPHPQVVGYGRRGRIVFEEEPEARRECEPLNLRTAGPHRGPEAIQVAPVSKADLGVYVHVPFCRHKCPFCDFYTFPIVKGDTIPNYFRALAAELDRIDAFGWARGETLSSVYFGGGTPSLSEAADLSGVLNRIRSRFEIAPNAEISMEINPEDVTQEKAVSWLEMGINRASLGVESLDDGELRRLERQHDAKASLDAFRTLREAGFANVSVDLMYALEGHDPKRWEETLRRVVDWSPDHISAYSLTIEERTRYAKEQRLGKLRVPEEEVQVELFLKTRSLLSGAGYAPYEISNFTRPGFESRHNLIYWTGGEYWGLGVSAHSFRKRHGSFERWWNPPDIRSYTRKLNEEKTLPRESETLSPEVHWGERLMTGLRLTEGVSIRELTTQIGAPMPEAAAAGIQRFLDSGHLRRRGERLFLTEPGIIVSNEVFRSLLS